MYKQVVGIYMHACRLTALRQLQAYSRKPHPLCEGCGFREYLHYRYLQVCTTVSHYYREMCFDLATCADFTISNFGEL